MPPSPPRPIHFGPHLVTPQVFHTTAHTYALVNIKPILPGHTLICPLRPTASRLRDLSGAETADLFLTVRRVGKMLERMFGASALTVAVQDGRAAGQTVGHVHAHVIPRREGDMDGRGGNDAIYEILEGGNGGDGGSDGGDGGDGKRVIKPDAEREPRSEAEMNREASWLRGEMVKEEMGEQE